METTTPPPPGAGGASAAKTPLRTPGRRASSAEPPPSRRSVHTPLDQNATRELVNSIRRSTMASGGRRSNAPTPHAKAARRALNQRRTAMFTPGKNRRRSQIQNRESPMSFLKDLGRVLAPTSKPIISSSSPSDSLASSILPNQNEEDDERPINPPRFSLPIDEDDEDESDLEVPQSSMLENTNYTMQSIELPRRAISEQPNQRFSYGSYDGTRMSGIFENEIPGDISQHSDFFPGLLEDIQARAAVDDGAYERYVICSCNPFHCC
jgi:hypothetical protein